MGLFLKEECLTGWGVTCQACYKKSNRLTIIINIISISLTYLLFFMYLSILVRYDESMDTL